MKSIRMVWSVACQWWAKWKTMQVADAANVEETPRMVGNNQFRISGEEKKAEAKARERSALLMERLQSFLLSHYEFRYNVLTEVTEFRSLKDKKRGFRPANQRELNSICIDMRAQGIDC